MHYSTNRLRFLTPQFIKIGKTREYSKLQWLNFEYEAPFTCFLNKERGVKRRPLSYSFKMEGGGGGFKDIKHSTKLKDNNDIGNSVVKGDVCKSFLKRKYASKMSASICTRQ